MVKETRKRSLDLYDVFQILQERCGFSIEDIGKLYVSGVASANRRHLLSKYPSVGEPATQHIKRDFQKGIRAYFFDIKNSYLIDGETREAIMGSRTNTLPQDALDRFQSNATTIEGVITDLLSKKESYSTIGQAVIDGSKTYLSKKPDQSKDLPYRIYLEYTTTLEKLKTID